MPEETIVKDRTSELAEQKLVQLETAEQVKKDAEAKAKAEAESKGAAAEESSTETVDKTDKTEGTEKEANSEEKSDVELLKAEDKDLTEPEKVRKEDIIKKAEAAKTPEQKLKEWQDTTQKRIDELSGNLKAEREGRRQDSDVIKNLEGRIATMQAELEKTGSIESDSVRDYKTDKERYAKMVVEDKDLPREARREMSDDELEEYLLENHREANEWLVRRELRRRDDILERQKSRQAATTIKQKAETFFKEFPGCNQETRHKELVQSGKTDAQAIEILMGENDDFKMMMNVIKENPSFSNPENGPELLAAEMKRRKTQTQSNVDKTTFTKEDVEMAKQQAAEAERQRLASIDTGLTSSVTTATLSKGSPIYQEGLKLFIQAGKRRGHQWTEKDYQDTLDYGKRNQTKER